ncbi:hypothetical protein NFI96_028486 [Prochilodus magdalenae]|nr:hypothetical protein NFI96_028486 [Prochilodus magdalenae]
MKLMVAVLMLLTLGAMGKVVRDFTECSGFFLNDEPPEFNDGTASPGRYVHICQKYQDTYHYATLYDTQNRIPVYSAYLYKRGSDCTIPRPSKTWMIEPQLEDNNNGDEMALQGHMRIYNNQAYNSDYENSGYNKGHLYPFCHIDSEDAGKSTFTLTNAAPQKCDFNKRWYSKVENDVRKSLDDCVNTGRKAHVVTGVVPSRGDEYLVIKHRVNVPSFFWTAFRCCDRTLVLRMKLLTLLLVLGFTSLAASEVVSSFKESCSQFFIRNPNNQNEVITPTVLVEEKRYKQICQYWSGTHRYATLYDTLNRIPVYSAYTYYRKGETAQEKVWKIEPQLDLAPKADNRGMVEETPEMASKLFFQATYKDYRGFSIFERGHVFPNGYGADKAQSESTYTLTNAAPQTGTSNRAWEVQVEEPMRKEIETKCKLSEHSPAYIVTGVVPGEKWLAITRANKELVKGVNVPSHYWTAFSCTDNKKEHISKAYLAQQENPSLKKQFQNQEMSVDQLNTELTALYGRPFSVFGKKLERRNSAKF